MYDLPIHNDGLFLSSARHISYIKAGLIQASVRPMLL